MRKVSRPAGMLALCLCLIPALAFANARKVGTQTPQQAQLSASGVLRLAMPDTSPQVDPALVGDEANVQFAGLLYSGLVALDSHYRVVPAAATRYTVGRDHRTYTFFLRPNIRFSNGDPITAQDFAFSIKRSLSPKLKSPSAPTYLLDIQGASAYLAGKAKSISGIKVLGPRTIQLTARWDVPYFLTELAYPTSYVLEQKSVTKYGPMDNTAWYGSPISSGPYRLKSWSSNNKLTLVPNKYFQGPRPALKQITILLDALPSTDLYKYVSHTVDVASLPSLDRSYIHQAGVVEKKMLAIDGIYMNLKSRPFEDVRVRRALAMAVNRSQVVNRSFGASASPFAGFVPPGQDGYDAQLHTLRFDPAAARLSLRSAGYSAARSFPPITLYFAEDTTLATLAQLVASSWHKVLGINVQTQALTSNTLLARIQANSLPLFLFGVTADYPDAHDWLALQWESGALYNNVNYHSARFDKIAKTADVTWDWQQRLRLYDDAQQILADDTVSIPLYIPHRVVYVRPSLINLYVTGYGIIPRLGSWAQVRFQPPPKPHRTF